jgi:hypothetical protein
MLEFVLYTARHCGVARSAGDKNIAAIPTALTKVTGARPQEIAGTPACKISSRVYQGRARSPSPT